MKLTRRGAAPFGSASLEAKSCQMNTEFHVVDGLNRFTALLKLLHQPLPESEAETSILDHEFRKCKLATSGKQPYRLNMVLRPTVFQDRSFWKDFWGIPL